MDAIVDSHALLEAPVDPATAGRKARRKQLLLGLSGAVAAVLAGGFAYQTLIASRHATIGGGTSGTAFGASQAGG